MNTNNDVTKYGNSDRGVTQGNVIFLSKKHFCDRSRLRLHCAVVGRIRLLIDLSLHWSKRQFYLKCFSTTSQDWMRLTKLLFISSGLEKERWEGPYAGMGQRSHPAFSSSNFDRKWKIFFECASPLKNTLNPASPISIGHRPIGTKYDNEWIKKNKSIKKERKENNHHYIHVVSFCSTANNSLVMGFCGSADKLRWFESYSKLSLTKLISAYRKCDVPCLSCQSEMKGLKMF